VNLVGGIFGTIGMVQAVETGDEIKASFEKGSKWVKNEADSHWSSIIGATKDTTITASRIAWPNPAIKDLPDPLPSGDYPRVDVQITFPIRLPNDGIVGCAQCRGGALVKIGRKHMQAFVEACERWQIRKAHKQPVVVRALTVSAAE
jgi:hypothetical protein